MPEHGGPPEPRRLEIRLIHGNIVNVSSPAYVLGVFDNVNPTGAGRTVDSLLGGALSRLITDRMIGTRKGEISVIPTPRRPTLCDAVVLAGLGPIDEFEPNVLERVGENLARVLHVSRITAATIVPMGANTGLTVDVSVLSILEGFVAGLERNDTDHEFKSLGICEFDARRFVVLDALFRPGLKSYNVKKSPIDLLIRHSEVDKAAPLAAAAQQAPELIEPTYLVVGSKRNSNGDRKLFYSVLTSGTGAAIKKGEIAINHSAAGATNARLAQAKEISELFGREVAAFYLPSEMTVTLQTSLRPADQTGDGGSSQRFPYFVVAHDRDSSDIAWEAMHFGSWCPALEVGLSRKLTTNEAIVTRSNLPADRELRMLVIHSPETDDPSRELECAEQEGERLAALFRDNKLNAAVEVIHWADATCDAVAKALEKEDFDILHYAGHADFDVDDAGNSGLLCSDGRLTANDLARIPVVPQLIFLNGCETARMRSVRAADTEAESAASERRPFRKRFDKVLAESASLSEMLMRKGATNFIGTYWPVNDKAALRFAMAFYGSFLAGDPIGLSLRKARRELADSKFGGRDWANYMHFGSPEYRLRRAPAPPRPSDVNAP